MPPLEGSALLLAFAARIVVQALEHKAYVLARFWLGWPLRHLIGWRVTGCLGHWIGLNTTRWQQTSLRGNPWCLE